MQAVTALCNNAKTFPLNLNQQNPSAYDLTLYEQLNTHAARLFSDEDESALDFLELSRSGKGTEPPYVPALKQENPKSGPRFLAEMYKDRNPVKRTLGAASFPQKL